MTTWLARLRPPRPCRPSRRALLVAAALVFVALAGALLGVGWLGSQRALHPPLREEQFEPDDFSLAVEEVRFPAADGVTIAGWFVRGHSPSTVILAHGYGHTRRHLLEHADYLAKEGYSVLLIDLRGQGESDGGITVGAFEPLDIEGAVTYLATRDDADANCVMAQGVSLGAAASIRAAADDPRIRAVVAEAAFKDVRSTIAAGFEHFIGLPSFPFAPVTVWIVERRIGADADDVSPQDEVGAIAPRPVFVIDDQADENIATDSGEVLYARAGEPKRSWFIDGAEHADGFERDPEGYRARVLAFYRELVPDCAPAPSPGAYHAARGQTRRNVRG